MSKRVQPTIEDFDDDTDLPLPSHPLPNTGPKGALIQSVDLDSDSDQDDDDDDDDDDDEREKESTLSPNIKTNINPGLASRSQLPPAFGLAPPPGAGAGTGMGPMRGTVTDLTPYKKWTCIYPIYIDAKRRYGVGSRRIARAKAVWWPLSKDIAEATTRLGLGTLHEVQKSHPSDWDNPGRVRVQWKRDGKLVNERIRTKKMLLEAIALYIQGIKPELIPKPPFNYSRPISLSSKQPQIKSASKSSKSKGGNTNQKPSSKSSHKRAPQRRLPQPPSPRPQLASSVSAYSPALPSGVLVETVKAGMSAIAAENANAPAGSGKGKRKVVRVRG
ncbi:SEC65 [Sanghuangporus sanghuang]